MSTFSPLHVVATMPRSGSTALLRGLIAGGMFAIESPKPAVRELRASAHRRGHLFQPSPTVHEPSINQLTRLAEVGSNHAVKVLYQTRHAFRAGPRPLHVVVLLRDPQQIDASYIRVFERSFEYRDTYFSRMSAWAIDWTILLNVESLTVAWRDELANRPDRLFSQLREAGWPVEPSAAALGASTSVATTRR